MENEGFKKRYSDVTCKALQLEEDIVSVTQKATEKKLNEAVYRTNSGRHDMKENNWNIS